jgi:acetyl esterase
VKETAMKATWIAGWVSAAVFLGVATMHGAEGEGKDRPAPDSREQQIRQQAEKATQAFFGRVDKNKDGKIAREEVPQASREFFDRIDTDGDGAITLAEDTAWRMARAKGPRQRPTRPQPPKPDHSNVSYGPHERNVLDVWLAKSDTPMPLVVYYHGGGFRGGDKRTINVSLLKKLLDGGVSVAAVNYRLTNVAPFPAQMHDCARAMQFLRHHAPKYNVDPKRVGATGGSAGAIISMWLAFHEDLADVNAKDPVARQSTRLSVAVVYAAQSTIDPRTIQKMYNTNQVDGALIPFYGMKEASDIDDPKFHPLFVEASPINHATKDDPPVLAYYPQANQPLPPNSSGKQHIHHPKFGLLLKKKLDELGVECVVRLREDCPGGAPVDEYVKFFFDKLGVKTKK